MLVASNGYVMIFYRNVCIVSEQSKYENDAKTKASSASALTSVIFPETV